MKKVIIGLALLVLMVIMIVIFQNISGGNYVYVLFFYWTQSDGYVMPLLVMAALGFVGGALCTMLIADVITSSRDEEAPGGANW